jgi:hypothetical protein
VALSKTTQAAIRRQTDRIPDGMFRCNLIKLFILSPDGYFIQVYLNNHTKRLLPVNYAGINYGTIF